MQISNALSNRFILASQVQWKVSQKNIRSTNLSVSLIASNVLMKMFFRRKLWNSQRNLKKQMLLKDSLNLSRRIFEKPTKNSENQLHSDIISKRKKHFRQSQECWICKKEFQDDKIRDHCHYTGKYRGAAHSECRKKPNFIPVVFHNLSGYDSHLFIKNLGATEGNINCIPDNEEKYISFSKNIVVGYFLDKEGNKKNITQQLRFIDSFKFMATSLEKLVEATPQEKFKSLKKEFESDRISIELRWLPIVL